MSYIHVRYCSHRMCIQHSIGLSRNGDCDSTLTVVSIEMFGCTVTRIEFFSVVHENYQGEAAGVSIHMGG